MNFTGSKLRVAVLRGGPSREYEVSLKTGDHVLSLLHEMPDGYEAHDVLISRDGEWHRSGLTKSPQAALEHVDVVFNALHGEYGEDGQVQRLLESLGVPYTGSRTMGAAISMNKDMAKNVYESHGLLTPRHVVLTRETLTGEVLRDIFQNYLHPLIVKPANGGSSLSIHLVYGHKDLIRAVEDVLAYSPKVIVEEFIRGKEGTCAVVENARGEKLYALIPVEIQKDKNSFFDFDSKYSGTANELCPGTFSTEENKKIEALAKKAHTALGLRHYSRSDFIITSRGNVYILETNSLPGLTRESLLPKSLKAVGWEPKEFVHHLINLALNKV